MSTEDAFKRWLLQKLRSMDFDEVVFADYIMGILTSEDTQSEKRECLRDFLSGAAEHELSDLCDEICDEWHKIQNSECVRNEVVLGSGTIDLGEKLACIIEKQSQSVAKVIHTADSEKKLKEVILAQYSQVSDDEGDEDPEDSFEESGSKSTSSTGSYIPQNTNIQAVISAEKELREKAKMEFEKKKAQDKVNKEKQKQKQQERKERERKRTQKGEHRR